MKKKMECFLFCLDRALREQIIYGAKKKLGVLSWVRWELAYQA